MSKGTLGGRFTFPGTSLTVQRIGYGAMQLAGPLAWLLQRSPNILVIPGTSSVAHLRENLAAGELTLSRQDVADLDGIAAAHHAHG